MLKIISSRSWSCFFAIVWALSLAACGGGGSGSSTTSTTTTATAPTPVANAVSLSASLTSVASDNSNTSTITATVTDASNAAVAGVPVAFSVDSGILSAGTVTSDATGKAVVTFSAGANATTRTATIVATASGKTSQIPVRISGSSLTPTVTSSSLIVGGPTTALAIVAKNSAGTTIAGQTITLTQSGTGSVTFSPASGTTDATGTFTTTVAAVTAGTVTITASGVGETRTTTLTITGTSTAFQITTLSTDATQNGKTINVAVPVTVSAPSPTSTVTFVTTLGTWDATNSSVVTKSVVGGTVTAQLISASAGVANVQTYDTARQSTVSDSRVVSFTAACTSATKITLQSSPSIVAPSSSGTTNLSTLVATVSDNLGNPVGACSIAFNLVNPTGGGETVSPAVALTSSVSSAGSGLGQATTTFTAGSLPSGANGVQIRGTVVRDPALGLPVIATNTAPSGSDATVVIGGTAGSVTIGVSSVATDSGSGTIYVLPMSVLVADSNGNPVANTTVSLSAWPIAWNAGGNACNTGSVGGTFYYNEDVNEDLVLQSSEDGVRRIYGTTTYVAGGTVDGQLTPPNSAAGTLPATVTTGSNGVATFSLTYTKSNARYIVDRIRARTIVQGTETLGEVNFGLPALLTDIGPPCLLSTTSPYAF